jgi:phosphoribosyl-AMP cyclohydrolase
MKDIEQVKFEQGLVPAIVQDYMSGEVLMLAYMNKESFEKTLETGTTWFWSRSRKKLWNKGETSGHFLHVKNIYFDCDGDTLLIKVEQTGPACHTGSRTCFYREITILNAQ